MEESLQLTINDIDYLVQFDDDTGEVLNVCRWAGLKVIPIDDPQPDLVEKIQQRIIRYYATQLRADS